MPTPMMELCNHLTVVVRELAEKRLGSREIVAEFRKRHARAIAKATRELEDRALVQLVSQVSHRRPAPALAPEGPDLFGYRVSTVVVIPKEVGGKTRSTRALTIDMNERELKAWIDTHSQQRDEITEEVAEMTRLYKDAKPFFKRTDTTVEEALAAKLDKEGAKVSAET